MHCCRVATLPAKCGVRFCSVWVFGTVFNEISVVLKCLGPVLGCKNTCPINPASESVLVYFRGQINSLGLGAFLVASGIALKPNHLHQQKTFTPHFLCIRYAHFTHKNTTQKFLLCLALGSAELVGFRYNVLTKPGRYKVCWACARLQINTCLINQASDYVLAQFKAKINRWV